MLARLLEDHRRIGLIVDHIDSVLNTNCPVDISQLAQLRWTLARELLQHIAIEDRFLAGSPRSGGMVLSRVQRLLCDHHARWTGDRIVSGWAEYRIAASGLLAAVRARINHEEMDIFPQIERSRVCSVKTCNS